MPRNRNTKTHPSPLRRIRASHHLAPRQATLVKKEPTMAQAQPWLNPGLRHNELLIRKRIPLPGANRLFTVLLSESCLLIWKLRCKWRIQREGDPSQLHTVDEIKSRWLSMINTRLHLDCLLTNPRRYGRHAIPIRTVHSTWQGTLQDELGLPDDWHRQTGVLVV